jgi:hypothetical protein
MVFSDLLLPDTRHVSLTSQASALSVTTEQRLCFTDIPLFWSRDDVYCFIRLLILRAAIGITSIKIGQKDNKKMAFVTVRDMALAKERTDLSNTRQGHTGAERPVGIFMANEPGKCNKCQRPGHSGKQCRLCSICQTWVLCPRAPARRPPPAVASSSTTPARPILDLNTQQPIPTFLLQAVANSTALLAPAAPLVHQAAPAHPPPPPPPAPAAPQPPPPQYPAAPQAQPSQNPAAPQAPPPAEVGTAALHAATAARLVAIWEHMERLNNQMTTMVPGSIRMRSCHNMTEGLIAEADQLEALVLSSPQIHPPG